VLDGAGLDVPADHACAKASLTVLVDRKRAIANAHSNHHAISGARILERSDDAKHVTRIFVNFEERAYRSLQEFG